MTPVEEMGAELGGSSLDWASAVAGVPYSLATELRPDAEVIEMERFYLPEEEILPNAEVVRYHTVPTCGPFLIVRAATLLFHVH